MIYKIKRIIRKLLPNSIFNFLIRHNIFFQVPDETFSSYEDYLVAIRNKSILSEYNHSFKNKKVMEIGMGGYYGLGLCYLSFGCKSVILQEKYRKHSLSVQKKHLIKMKNAMIKKDIAIPNQKLIDLSRKNSVFNSQKFKITYEDVHDLIGNIEPCSYIFTNSVLEHVTDVTSLLKDCYDLLIDSGIMIHYIDLRDHYFKKPFEMLKFSKKTWKFFFDPGHLNRMRASDYIKIHEKLGMNILELKIIKKDLNTLEKEYNKIHPNFKKYDKNDLAIQIIILVAEK
jgi:hypothetical protein